MAGLISRRISSIKSNFLNPSISASFFTLTTTRPRPPIPIPHLNLHKPYLLHLLNFPPIPSRSTAIPKPYLSLCSRSFSTKEQQQQQQEEQVEEHPNSESAGFKHQEIEGPTVERDLSPLANETREVTEKLMRNIYGASRAMGIMCLVQLGLGAWLSYAASKSAPPTMAEVTTLMNAVAFGFPFSMALMLRSTLKPMHFFRKMEEIGRLQILTSTMQIAKHLNLFFFRLQGVSYLCIAGLSFGTLFFAFVR